MHNYSNILILIFNGLVINEWNRIGGAVLLDSPFKNNPYLHKCCCTNCPKKLIFLLAVIVSWLFLAFPQLDAGKEYQYTPPAQPPIRPPYQQACHLRKKNLLSREDAPSVCPTQSQDEPEPNAESTWSKSVMLLVVWRKKQTQKTKSANTRIRWIVTIKRTLSWQMRRWLTV